MRAASAAPPAAEAPHPPAGPEPPHPSVSSQRGLDWFIFFVADVQTGFGPFVSVYLTSMAWTQVDIGLDADHRQPRGASPARCRAAPSSTRRAPSASSPAIAVVLIGLSALMYALWPVYPAVLSASVLHAAASCVLGPAMAAISLGLVGHAGIERTPRPQRALRLDRQRRRGRRHGRVRLLHLQPRGLFRHRAAAGAGPDRAAPTSAPARSIRSAPMAARPRSRRNGRCPA